MKVLHLPANIASQAAVTVRALRDIGIDARGLVSSNTEMQDGHGIENYRIDPRRKHPWRGLKQSWPFWKAVYKALAWADVIHWHYSQRALPFALDLRYAAHLKKASIVEFWGSDIRIPEIAIADNPYMAKLYNSCPQMRITPGQSRRAQRRFARFGFACLIPGHELMPYVQADIFPSPFRTRARVVLSDYDPQYPDPNNPCPVVVHAPSHKGKKFSHHIIRTVEGLRSDCNFTFRVIHGVSHGEAIKAIRESDILVDEIAPGEYGLAAIEAMALGKPSLNYIKPSILRLLPQELPIVNAHPDNLAQVLRDLLKDGTRRHEIGRQGRAYVEKYHDAHKIAAQLVAIYEQLLGGAIPL